MRVIQMKNQAHIDNPVLQTVFKRKKPMFRSRFLVSKGKSYFVLPVVDIAYFYVSGEMIYAVLFNKTEYHINSNMKTLEEELDPNMFFRANRQFSINVKSINRFENYFNGKLVVKTFPESNEKIVVSKIKARSFKEWIDK